MELNEKKMKKLLEANLQRIYETISGIGDLFEKRSKAQELLETYDDDELGSLKESVVKMVAECDEAIKTGVESGKKVTELNKNLEAANVSLTESQKELDRLIQENAELSKKLEEALNILDSAKAFSNDTEKVLNEALAVKNNSVSFAEYEKLREYTVNVVRAYNEQKSLLKKYGEDRKKLALKLKSVNESRKLEEKKADTAQKLAERQKKVVEDKKVLDERRRVYEAEQTLLRKAAPDVLQYFKDTVPIYPELMKYREKILSKRTLFEAQMTVINILHPVGETESISENSPPISITQSNPEPQMRFRKGEL